MSKQKKAATKKPASRQEMTPLRMVPQCGSCSACCTILSVPALEKPAGVSCRFLKGAEEAARSGSKGMCTLYAKPVPPKTAERDAYRSGDFKPAACRDFGCLWLRQEIEYALSPHETGVVFLMSTDQRKLCAYETRPGAASAGLAADFIASTVAAGLPVIVLPYHAPGEEEPPKKILPPPPGLNPDFDLEIQKLAVSMLTIDEIREKTRDTLERG